MTQITKEQAIDYLGSLTPSEMAILIENLEETWGISLNRPTQQAPEVEEEKEEEQTEFDVILESFGDKKIDVIQTVRQVRPGLGLKEAKEFVESVPVTVGEGLSKEEAAEMQSKLEEAGATIKVV